MWSLRKVASLLLLLPFLLLLLLASIVRSSPYPDSREVLCDIIDKRPSWQSGLNWDEKCFNNETLDLMWTGIRALDSDGNITAFVYDGAFAHMDGSLPEEWGALVHMTELNLYSHAFTGSLPPAWSKLSNLRRLYLGLGHLSGTLPPQWSTLTRLEHLGLGNNFLTGTLPSEWSNMQSLQTLYAASNRLNGTLPQEWSVMSALGELVCPYNSLSGRLSHLPDLAKLYLSHNHLSGSLSGNWSTTFGDYATILLSHNQLTGTIPAEWTSMGILDELRLDNNPLSATLPIQIPRARKISFAHCNMTGSLPAEWGVSWMTEFILSHNHFTGSLPPEWSSVRRMENLHLDHNSLTGRLPAEWSSLYVAGDFSLSHNYISGTLPPEWGSFLQNSIEYLYRLELGYNLISGTLPSAWSTLSRLKILTLEENTNMTGCTPIEWNAGLTVLSEGTGISSIACSPSPSPSFSPTPSSSPTNSPSSTTSASITCSSSRTSSHSHSPSPTSSRTPSSLPTISSSPTGSSSPTSSSSAAVSSSPTPSSSLTSSPSTSAAQTVTLSQSPSALVSNRQSSSSSATSSLCASSPSSHPPSVTPSISSARSPFVSTHQESPSPVLTATMSRYSPPSSSSSSSLRASPSVECFDNTTCQFTPGAGKAQLSIQQAEDGGLHELTLPQGFCSPLASVHVVPYLGPLDDCSVLTPFTSPDTQRQLHDNMSLRLSGSTFGSCQEVQSIPPVLFFEAVEIVCVSTLPGKVDEEEQRSARRCEAHQAVPLPCQINPWRSVFLSRPLRRNLSNSIEVEKHHFLRRELNDAAFMLVNGGEKVSFLVGSQDLRTPYTEEGAFFPWSFRTVAIRVEGGLQRLKASESVASLITLQFVLDGFDSLDSETTFSTTLPSYDVMCSSNLTGGASDLHYDSQDLCDRESFSLALAIKYTGHWIHNSESDKEWLPSEPVNIAYQLRCPGLDCTGPGILYVPDCLGYSTGESCMSRRHGTDYSCAYRQNAKCYPCPSGALCPGGFRIWPLPGFWSSGSTSSSVLECSGPSGRCLGWNVTTSSSTCGSAYVGVACSQCAAGHYTAQRECSPCPEGHLVVLFWDHLSLVGASLVSTLLLIFVMLWSLLKRRQVPQPGRRSLAMMRDFVEWMLIVVQQLAQVAKLSAPGLPKAWVKFAQVLQLVRFDAASVAPPECSQHYPFAVYAASLSTGLGCVLAVFASLLLERALYSKKPSRRCIWRQRSLLCSLSSSSLLYSLTVATALTLLNCMNIEGEYLWAVQTRYHCYEEGHFVVASLAWICLLLVGVGLPAVLLFGSGRLLRNMIPDCKTRNLLRLPRESHARVRNVRRWGSVFRHGEAWYRPATLVILLLTGALDLSAERPVHVTNLIVITKSLSAGLLLGFGFLAFLLRPQHDMIRWQRWPDLAVNILSALIACVQATFTRDKSIHGRITSSSRILLWGTVGMICLLPVVFVGSFMAWLMGLLGVRCCRWASPHDAHARKVILAGVLGTAGENLSSSEKPGRRLSLSVIRTQPELSMGQEEDPNIQTSPTTTRSMVQSHEWIVNPLTSASETTVKSRIHESPPKEGEVEGQEDFLCTAGKPEPRCVSQEGGYGLEVDDPGPPPELRHSMEERGHAPLSCHLEVGDMEAIPKDGRSEEAQDVVDQATLAMEVGGLRRWRKLNSRVRAKRLAAALRKQKRLRATKREGELGRHVIQYIDLVNGTASSQT